MATFLCFSLNPRKRPLVEGKPTSNRIPGLQPASQDFRSYEGTHGCYQLCFRPTLTPRNSDLALGSHQLPREVLRVRSSCIGLYHGGQGGRFVRADGNHCRAPLVVGHMGIESLTGAWNSSWVAESSYRNSTPAWSNSRRPRRFLLAFEETWGSNDRVYLGIRQQTGQGLTDGFLLDSRSHYDNKGTSSRNDHGIWEWKMYITGCPNQGDIIVVRGRGPQDFRTQLPAVPCIVQLSCPSRPTLIWCFPRCR